MTFAMSSAEVLPIELARARLEVAAEHGLGRVCSFVPRRQHRVDEADKGGAARMGSRFS